MTSCVYVGTVRHRRRRPTVHDFRYRAYMFYLNLDELDEITRRVRAFSLNRFNLVSFHETDYMDRTPGSLKQKVLSFIREQRGREVAARQVFMLTNCRILGYVFNPITLYYCQTLGGALDAVVAEVTNTHGERCHYLLEAPDGGGSSLRGRARKTMDVSPFISMNAVYDFHLPEVGDRAAVGIVEREADTHVLDAQFWGERRPLTSAQIARLLVTHPLMTLKTITAIHAEALRLYLKRVPVHRRP